MIVLLKDYKKTIGSILDVKWQRERRMAENGVFSRNDVGNLIIQIREGETDAEQIINSCYISFTRTDNENENELCLAIRSMLLRKYFPESQEAIFKNAINKNCIVIPVPIMLKIGDKILIFKFIDGKPKGRTFKITDVFK